MAMLFNNTNRTRYNTDGELIRQKLPGFEALSIGYGQLLAIDVTEGKPCKAFFLFANFNPATGDSFPPATIRKMPMYNSLSDELMPYSKKFTVSDEVSTVLKIGQEYWFTYTSTPVNKTIENKGVTYEELKLVHLGDSNGIDALRSILECLKINLNKPG